MTFTIWSNGGKHEWIVYQGDDIVSRSGLVFNSRNAAFAAGKKALLELIETFHVKQREAL